jgi:hypothetical protein
VPWRPSQVHPSAMLNAACLHAHAGAVPHAAVCRPTRAAAYGSPSLGAFVSVCKDGEPPPHCCLSVETGHTTTAERVPVRARATHQGRRR